MSRAQFFEVWVSSLKLQMGEIVKTRDDASCFANEQSRESSILDACVELLKNELNSVVRKGSTGCDMEAVCCRAAVAKGEINSFVDGPGRDTSDSCASCDTLSTNRCSQ